MTEIEVKRFLNRPHELAKEIKKTRTLIEELYTNLLPSAIRYDKEKVQTSPEDKQAEIVIRINQLEKELNKLSEERDKAIVDAIDAINLLTDINQRSVLINYHVLDLGDEATADDIGYSVSQMWRIKNKAIEELAKRIKLDSE